jgi:hypothetical protein
MKEDNNMTTTNANTATNEEKLTKTIRAAKRDASSKIGGFAVYRFSDNTFDYFPVGQPANRGGIVDRTARIVTKFAWRSNRFIQL